MQLTRAIRKRHMVRRYDRSRAVSSDVVGRIVRAGLRGPSAGFSQGVEFLILTTPAQLTRYWNATTAPGPPDAWLRGMQSAPVLVLCLADPDAYLDRYAEADKGWDDRDPACWPIPYWDVDTGMGAMLILLSAVDEGLGACFFGVPAVRHDAVRAAFGIPQARRLVGVISLGHPASEDVPGGSARTRPRRPVSQTLHFGEYGSGSQS